MAFAAAAVSLAANAATLTLGDASLSGDQLTVPVTVSGSSGGTLELYIGEAGPKDGNPSATVSATSLAISSDGDYNLTAQISVGAKIAYKAVLGSDESASGSITATDSVQYIWVNNATGLWSDPNNWTRDSNDGYKNIGYPAYTTGFIRFYGNQTAEVTLDANYGRFGDLFIDNPNLNLTIHGNGYELKTGNTHTTGDNNFVFDNVRYTTYGSYTVGSRSSARLINGTYFQTQWEFNVNGSGSASLYVGPNCEINCGVGDGNAYAFRLDGTGNSIVIEDGYVHSRGLRIGQNREEVPAGIVFKGTHPRLECYNEFVVCKNLSGSPVFEFYVPVGGYSQPPIRKTAGGNYIALGNKWANHTDSSSVYSPVAFSINERSPFYQSETSSEICLFDWSASDQGIRDNSFVFMNEQATSPDNYLYAVKANSSCETSQDQIWAHLTGTGAPASISYIDTGLSVSVNTGTAQLTATGTVTELGEGTTVAVLYIDEVEPNGTVRTVRAAEQVVSATGEVSLTGTVTLGVEARSSIVLENTQGLDVYLSSSATNTASVANNLTFKWKDSTTGLWSDPDNWELEGTAPTDGLPRLSYPTRGCKVRFYGNQVDVIQVDGDYTDLDNIQLGWGGADLTFVGTVEGAALHTGGFKDMPTANVTNRFDGVTLYGSSYHLYNNGVVELFNGGGLSMRWEVAVRGENARMYVGTNCTVFVSTAEAWHRLELAGKDAEIIIDGGVVDALCLWIGYSVANYAPKGITFRGKTAQLKLRDVNGDRASSIVNAIPGSPVFNFIIPEGGFESTPIVRTGGGGTTLFAQSSADIPAVTFTVDRSSPYLKVRGNFTQQLVDWSTSSAATKLNTDGVAFGAVPRVGEFFYFTPTEGEAKSGVAVSCLGSSGFAIIVR